MDAMNLQIYEEASEWIVKHRDGGLGAQEKQSFDAWLRESPQHVRAYLEMSSVWEDVPSLDPTWNANADELIAGARTDNNLVSFSSPSLSAGSSVSGAKRLDNRLRDAVENRRERTENPSVQSEASAQPLVRLTDKEGAHTNRRVRFLGTLAASILIAFTGSWLYLQRGVYTTDIGEQRSLALADGSTVELNSRSRIKVQYTEHERRIDLLEGQALFHVAKNKLRPFIVHTGDTRVRAVGTAFDVYKTGSGAVVTVVEGRVAVRIGERLQGAASGLQLQGGDSPKAADLPVPTRRTPSPKIEEAERAVSLTEKAPASAQRQADASGSASAPESSAIQAVTGEILLAAGEQIVVTPAIVTSPKRADVAAATAWTRRSLVFDSSPLTEVAQEFNRYNARRLVIEDPRLADFHVSGVFSSVEPTLFLQFLRTQPELVVEETDTEIRIRRK